jgi:hypothetical protein
MINSCLVVFINAFLIVLFGKSSFEKSTFPQIFFFFFFLPSSSLVALFLEWSIETRFGALWLSRPVWSLVSSVELCMVLAPGLQLWRRSFHTIKRLEVSSVVPVCF